MVLLTSGFNVCFGENYSVATENSVFQFSFSYEVDSINMAVQMEKIKVKFKDEVFTIGCKPHDTLATFQDKVERYIEENLGGDDLNSDYVFFNSAGQIIDNIGAVKEQQVVTFGQREINDNNNKVEMPKPLPSPSDRVSSVKTDVLNCVVATKVSNASLCYSK
jgi:hypothetical protein